MSCVVNKLLYGLQTAWLTKIQRRRLDSFHLRCLRRILGIRPAFISRVSDTSVLSRLNTYRLSNLLLEQQLLLFGKIARLSYNHPIRNLVFEKNSLDIRSVQFKRRRGRPRANWTSEIYRHAIKISSDQVFEDLIQDELRWKTAIRQYCRE